MSGWERVLNKREREKLLKELKRAAGIDDMTIWMVALGLAALSFVGTIALAKYLADEQIF